MFTTRPTHPTKFLAFAVVIAGCSKSGTTPTVADDAGGQPTTSIAASASVASGARSLSATLKAADPSTTPRVDFWKLHAWAYVPVEKSRASADGKFGWPASKFFERACPELADKSLVEKDEFDRERATEARKKARVACLERVAQRAGAPARLHRLRYGFKNVEWSPDSKGFYPGLVADKTMLLSSSEERRRIEVQDTDNLDPCGGPGLISIEIPAETLVGLKYYAALSISVADVDRAKKLKSIMGGERGGMEMLIETGDFGRTGTKCRRGGGTTRHVWEEDVQGYNARLIAVRLLDGDTGISEWVPADAHQLPESSIVLRR